MTVDRSLILIADFLITVAVAAAISIRKGIVGQRRTARPLVQLGSRQGACEGSSSDDGSRNTSAEPRRWTSSQIALVDEATILDINLRGEMACAMAERLRENPSPSFLATGYERWPIPAASKGILLG